MRVPRKSSLAVALATAAVITSATAAPAAAATGVLEFRDFQGRIVERFVDPETGCYPIHEAGTVTADLDPSTGAAVLLSGPRCLGGSDRLLGPSPVIVYTFQSVAVVDPVPERSAEPGAADARAADARAVDGAAADVPWRATAG